MAKRKQTAGERIVSDMAVYPKGFMTEDAESALDAELTKAARRIDRAIRAAEKRGYERGSKVRSGK